jgi:hypothetical protein
MFKKYFILALCTITITPNLYSMRMVPTAARALAQASKAPAAKIKIPAKQCVSRSMATFNPNSRPLIRVAPPRAIGRPIISALTPYHRPPSALAKTNRDQDQDIDALSRDFSRVSLNTTNPTESKEVLKVTGLSFSSAYKRTILHMLTCQVLGMAPQQEVSTHTMTWFLPYFMGQDEKFTCEVYKRATEVIENYREGNNTLQPLFFSVLVMFSPQCKELFHAAAQNSVFMNTQNFEKIFAIAQATHQETEHNTGTSQLYKNNLTRYTTEHEFDTTLRACKDILFASLKTKKTPKK